MDYQQQISVPMSLPDITDKERDAVAKVMATNYLSMGPYVKSFEESFCNFTGAKHAVAVNSGTAGLHLCVQAAGHSRQMPGGLYGMYRYLSMQSTEKPAMGHRYGQI